MNYVLLEIYVDESKPELLEKYKAYIEKHNNELDNNLYPNAGFDLFIPDDIEFTVPFQTQMVDLFIKAQMWEVSPKSSDNSASVMELSTVPGTEDAIKINYTPSGYYLYPRSSMAKTQLMLSNHVGVIDSGYRNNVLCAFRYLSCNETKYKIESGVRLVQICHPLLLPIYVNLLTSKDELTITSRTGGFGSTGGTTTGTTGTTGTYGSPYAPPLQENAPVTGAGTII